MCSGKATLRQLLLILFKPRIEAAYFDAWEEECPDVELLCPLYNEMKATYPVFFPGYKLGWREPPQLFMCAYRFFSSVDSDGGEADPPETRRHLQRLMDEL